MPFTGVQSAVVGDRIKVTDNPQMHRIMRHEFSKGVRFDPAPLHQYLATLTREQVRLLMTYPMEKYLGKQRLVAFITLDEANTNVPMCADNCDGSGSLVNSNAHFALFRCDGASQNVSLVCYTKEFRLGAGRPKLEERTAAKPTVYKISAMNMTQVPPQEGDTIWHRVSRVGKGDVGTALAGGDANLAPNSLHGMINTVGCWMLFRNYNWYKPKQAEFLQVYREFRKSGNNMTESIRKMLRLLGYLDIDGVRIDRRFLNWERNYAYLWFLRDVVGIDYFSKNPFVTDLNVNDLVQLPAYPDPANAAQIAAMPYNAHSWNARRATEHSFKMSRNLWVDNALGFKTADDFAPFAGKDTHQLEKRSWADLYVYEM